MEVQLAPSVGFFLGYICWVKGISKSRHSIIAFHLVINAVFIVNQLMLNFTNGKHECRFSSAIKSRVSLNYFGNQSNEVRLHLQIPAFDYIHLWIHRASLALLVLWSFGPLDQHTSHCPLLLLFSKSRCRCYCLSLLPCYLGQQFNLLLPLNAWAA